MKIAFVSSIPAFPAIEGNRSRIAGLMKAVQSLGHEIWFLYLPTWGLSDVDEAAHQKHFGKGRFVRLSGEVTTGRVPPFFRLRRKLNRVTGRPSAFYNHLDEFYNEAWSTQLRSLQAKHRFDAVFVEYVFHSKAFSAFPRGILKILDTHDSFADRHLAFVNTPNKLGYWFSVPTKVERHGFKRADVILAIQEDEAERFSARLGNAPPMVKTVSHFIEAAIPVEDYGPTNAVFLASGNDANVISINYFCSEVLPLIRRGRPDFQLVLAGSICGKLADQPGIIKLGRVDRPIDAFRKAPLSLNPMLVGTGINIKLLDAMAAGVATVSTRTGARGLPLTFGEGVIQVPDEDPQAFANAVLSLVQNQDARRHAGARAYQAAKRWNEVQLEMLRSVLSSGP